MGVGGPSRVGFAMLGDEPWPLHEGDVDAVELERSHASEMDDVAVTLYIGDP